jgi:hypothetical protein
MQELHFILNSGEAQIKRKMEDCWKGKDMIKCPKLWHILLKNE